MFLNVLFLLSWTAIAGLLWFVLRSEIDASRASRAERRRAPPAASDGAKR